LKVGYLTARYPAVSQTFILREVEALRRLGAAVETFSVRRTDPAELLSEADREAFATTFAILPAGPARLARAQLAALRASPRAYLRALGVALRRSPPGLRARLWQLFYFAEATILAARCRELGVRHLHAHFANVASDVALLVAELTSSSREPITWSVALHGPVDFVEPTLGDKLHRALFATCISDFARSQAMAAVGEEDWDKFDIVHCGIEPDEYRPVDPGPANGRPAEVVSVGRLVSVKGHAVLLGALAELGRRGVDVHSTLIGAGPHRETLERIASELGVEERVTFAGAVAQDRVHDYLGRADVFCLASFAEGLPVVLMEAMAMELPVVATRIAGIPELLEDGANGLLVAPGREDLLADALARILRDPKASRRMARAGRRRVQEEFDVRESARRLLETFSRRVAA
jgi:glycosyltransferase involved in cell wall biosynthesis